MISAATLRKWLLFISIVLSGGLPWIPHVPLLVLFLAGYFLMPGSKRLDRRLMPVALLLGTILLITILRPGGIQGLSLLIRFANFLGGLLLLNLYLGQPSDSFAKDLYPMLKWMAVQALCTVVLGTFASFLFLHVNNQGTDYRTFFGLLNYHVMLDEATASIRPDGFFWEPGVFQAYLNIYLFLALFVFNSWRQALLAVIALLSTQSTTGVMILVILGGAYFLRRLKTGNVRNLVISLILAVIVLVPIGIIAAGNIQDKFVGESRGSFWARQYDLITGLNVMRANWLTGIGFDYDSYTQAARTLGYADSPLRGADTEDRKNTNGIVFLLYSIGLPLGLPFLIGMFRQRLLPHRWLVGILFFLSLLSETFVFTPIPLALMFSGLMGRRRPDRAPAPRQLDQAATY